MFVIIIIIISQNNYLDVVLQGLVKLLGGKNPTLYSYEKSLPYLPVPDLDATTKRVIIIYNTLLLSQI